MHDLTFWLEGCKTWATPNLSWTLPGFWDPGNLRTSESSFSRKTLPATCVTPYILHCFGVETLNNRSAVSGVTWWLQHQLHVPYLSQACAIWEGTQLWSLPTAFPSYRVPITSDRATEFLRCIERQGNVPQHTHLTHSQSARTVTDLKKVVKFL
jgi:hypothetical protein